MRLPGSKPSKWEGVDFMTLVPVRACEWVEDEAAGRVLVLQPRFATGLGARFLQPRLKGARRYVRVGLEDRGSFLWRQVGGQRPTGALALALAEAFPPHDEEVAERVARYVYHLAANHLITFANLPD